MLFSCLILSWVDDSLAFRRAHALPPPLPHLHATPPHTRYLWLHYRLAATASGGTLVVSAMGPTCPMVAAAYRYAHIA